MHIREHEEATPHQKNPEDCGWIRNRRGDCYLHGRPQLAQSKAAEVSHYRPTSQHVKQSRGCSKPGVEKQEAEVFPGELLGFTLGREALAKFVTAIKLGHVVTVSRMQKGAAASRRYLLQAFVRGVTAVMMQVAGQVNGDLLPFENFLVKKLEIVLVNLSIILLVKFGEDPVGFSGAEDDAIAFAHAASYALEEFNLGDIDIGIQLNVNSDQPPTMRQSERKITAALTSLPAAKPTARTEQTRKRHEAVIPIVVSGNSEDMRVRSIGSGQCRFIGFHQTLAIGFPIGDRIDLVTAENQNLTTRQLFVDFRQT
jgi:hypothetical protein